MSKPAFWREGRLWFGNRLVLWLVFCMAWAGADEATVLTLTREAQATVIVNGVTVQKDLQLPYHWDRANPGQQGEAIFNFEFDLPEAPVDVWGIYVPRLGNVYELWLNRVNLQSHGVMVPRMGNPQVSVRGLWKSGAVRHRGRRSFAHHQSIAHLHSGRCWPTGRAVQGHDRATG